jgi:predicted CopG family antitoxin
MQLGKMKGKTFSEVYKKEMLRKTTKSRQAELAGGKRDEEAAGDDGAG